MFIVKLLESFNNLNFDYLKPRPDINFLESFNDKKILMVGYCSWETTISSKCIKKFLKLDQSELLIYDLIVFGPDINYQSIKIIKSCLEKCNKIKKNCIFYGFSTLINLNIDNSRNMFRPINISLYPFNIINFKIINKDISWYYFLKYLILLVLLIYINVKFNKKLYKILLIIFILLGIFLPRKHIVYISNE